MVVHKEGYRGWGGKGNEKGSGVMVLDKMGGGGIIY